MAWFEVKSPKRVAKIRLDANFFVIGRGERIPIFHDDPSISREHAAVVIPKAGAIRVRDLGSKNGVLLNGKAIGRYAEKDVAVGDTLTIGATTLLLHEGEPPPKVAATIAAPAPRSAEPEATAKAKTGEAAATADALRVEGQEPAASESEATPAAGTPEAARVSTPGSPEDAKVSSAPTAVAVEPASSPRPESPASPRSAAESAAAAAASAAEAAASAALAANAAAQAASTGSSDGEVQDLSEIQDKGEAPPELLASDDDEFPELA